MYYDYFGGINRHSDLHAKPDAFSVTLIKCINSYTCKPFYVSDLSMSSYIYLLSSYIYIYTDIYTYKYIHICMYVCMHARMDLYMYVFYNARVCRCMYVRVCVSCSYKSTRRNDERATLFSHESRVLRREVRCAWKRELKIIS